MVKFSHKYTGEKFIGMNATLELIFKKLPSVEFGYSVKECPQLSGKAIKILHPFPAIACSCESLDVLHVL